MGGVSPLLGLEPVLFTERVHRLTVYTLFEGTSTSDSVRLAYRNIVKPGVHFRQEAITTIDPVARRVTTDVGTYDADVLVVALGADYDLDATPGLNEGGNEFYSVAGAERLREVIPTFSKGRAIVGVTSTPFKCPPAPSEAALMLHDHLTERGVRDACEISLIMPLGVPIPPSPAASQALLDTFAERGITFVPNRTVRALDAARRVALLDDQSEVPYDLFLGVPKHRVPSVVAASGMTEDGWIPVDPKNLKTRFPGVYAVGDVTSVGTPKAGVFSEGAARVVAASLIAEVQGGDQASPYGGAGSCYIELEETGSGAWTWPSSLGRRPQVASSNPLSLWPVRRRTLDPVVRPAGSDRSEVFQARSGGYVFPLRPRFSPAGG